MALLILAAVSGTGKSTIARALMSQEPNLRLSVSHTTRKPRPGEADGVDYHFVERSVFEADVAADRFVEWAEYAGNLYGTAHATIEAAAHAGIDLLFDVEVQGAGNLKAAYPEACACFILPPSWHALEARLRGRGTEDEDTVLRRLATGRRELVVAEHFDYLVVNDTLDEAVDAMAAILRAARLRTSAGLAQLQALRSESAQEV
jgi:guanylate kinase